MARIIPTVGRVVWFYPDDSFIGLYHSPGQPLAALIAHVWGDRMVNLMVIDSGGNPVPVTSVDLLGEDDSTEGRGRHATWMPYQIGQAKKHE
jgi:hypothetical protein